MISENTQKKILFVIPTLQAGGAERVIVNLLKAINREKFSPALAVVDLRNPLLMPEIPEDVKIFDLKSGRVLAALPRLFLLIWKLRPSVVFSTLAHLNVALGILRFVLPWGTVFLARESSVVSEVTKRRRSPTIWRLAYRIFYPQFDRVISQSKYMADDLINNFGLPPRKSVVINNPVDIKKIKKLAEAENSETPSELKGKRFFVAVGRLAPVKGFDILLQAFAMVDLPLYLCIVGDGSEAKRLRDMAGRLGLTGRVIFAGHRQNPYPLIARSEALILSSHYEGFPNVVLEALACGVPVIATPAIGGTVEILSHIPGCKLSVAISADSLADAIRAWVGETKSPIDSNFVEKYELGSITSQYEDLFEEALAE